ncbi:hypothetical protein DES53_1246 [Roseimicrobium gellanilyticum]|uniref:Uncharacterized protein n=1 Tax=Roseimicrobium gellanilyticum TaxID=748857 RepID=A0A366H0I3_9BACT|nr:hypothetical protein [Roseimicrobium gellanilyticum]RBP35206.1 hypothetical protein DES53_1246 [Roseimicrobium gellanilyticum]
MDSSGFFIIFVLFALFAVVFRLVAGTFDGERVESYIQDMGGQLLDKSWDPFGPGWFGEKDSRIYAIVYRDRLGHVHRAHVKTSMLSGVYLTNDEIITDPQAAPAEAGRPVYSAESIEREKAQLRKRLADLEELSRRDGPRTERLG